MTVRTLRRTSDGTVFTGMRYGGEYGEIWQGGAGVTEVVDFVLGTKTDTHLGLSNEYMMDVVQPGAEFRRGKGFLEVKVKDPDQNIYRTVKHGEWILRPISGEKYLAVVTPNLVGTEYEILFDGPALIEYERVMKKLLPAIEAVMPPVSDQQFIGLAQELADKLFREGWRQM